MTIVVGVDPSLTGTGVCRVDLAREYAPLPSPLTSFTAEVLTFGSAKPKEKTKREYSRRVSEIVDQVEPWIKDADLVMVESLAYGAKGEAVWVLPWIFGRIIDLCEKHDRQVLIANQSQVKRYACGNGAAKKEVAVLATVRRWPMIEITNNNEADAVVLSAIGCRWLGTPIDSAPKTCWVDVMKKIAT